MEDLDPGDEDHYWKVEDYRVHSQFLESNGKLSWIWRKGVNLGKQIAVTGVVVSSVSIAIPPLVALSTIGLALSIPAGFLLVTYACGETLMSTLLPIPSPPPFEQYELMSSDEEIYRDEHGLDKEYEDLKDMEAKGDNHEQDARHGLEMRIELVPKSNKEIDDSDQIPFNNYEVDEGLVSEIIEEGGCEEDVGEYMEEDEQPLNSKAIPYILEGINEADNEISLMEQEGLGMPRDSLRAVVVEAELGGESDSNVEQLTEDMAFLAPREIIQENDYRGNLAGIEEDELKSETTTLIEEIRDMGEIDQKSEDSRAEEIPEENDNAGRVSKDMSQDTGLEDLDVIPEGNEPPVDDEGVINGLNNDSNSDYLAFIEDETSGLICNEPASIEESELVVNVRIDGDRTVTDIHQRDKIRTSMLPNEDAMKMADGSGIVKSNNGSITPDLYVDSSDTMPEDARKMTDENGFNLPNNGRVTSDLIVDSLDMVLEGEDVSLKNVVEVTVDYHEVVIKSVKPLSEEYTENAPSQETSGSDKEKLAEEKVWEQINAMRTIVGYANTPHTSYAEELKALYVFTGVEPPVSSKDPADLADINEKLHFLMSIVGVK